MKYILLFTLSLTSFYAVKTTFRQKLVQAAISLTDDNVTYDPSYFAIAYPNGDVPKNKGVCTDVIIRTYRKVGIDLQKEVHIDMTKHFNLYPKMWGLKHADTNIDHRRIPNLMIFFSRHGKVLVKTTDPNDYSPGDIVCWDLGAGTTHIGIVIDQKSDDGKYYKVVHNIGAGQVVEDVLFDYKIIGHYYYQK